MTARALTLGARERIRGGGPAALRWIVAIAIGLGGFAIFVAMVGADPFAAFDEMVRSTLLDRTGLGEVTIAAAPILLCALATAVPARAGLWNLGGQGQLVMGVIGATAVSIWLPAGTSAWLAMPLLLIGGAVLGAAWFGLSALMRVTVNLNEAISSLLMSYIAVRVLDYLVHGPWKDPASLGFPQAAALPDAQRMPLIGDGRMHLGILVAVGIMVAVYYLIRHTRWGFRLRVAGGNGEAARRAGLPVNRLLAVAMLAGGALAGLAGVIQLTGVEYQARPGIAANYAFIGFLVSWMARHDPLKILVASLVIGAIVVGGDSLQIQSDLPGASVNILMALLLLAVLGRGARSRGPVT